MQTEFGERISKGFVPSKIAMRFGIRNGDDVYFITNSMYGRISAESYFLGKLIKGKFKFNPSKTFINSIYFKRVSGMAIPRFTLLDLKNIVLLMVKTDKKFKQL